MIFTGVFLFTGKKKRLLKEVMANLQQLDSVPTTCTISLPHTALPERLRILVEAARVGKTTESYNCNARKGHMEGGAVQLCSPVHTKHYQQPKLNNLMQKMGF